MIFRTAGTIIKNRAHRVGEAQTDITKGNSHYIICSRHDFVDIAAKCLSDIK
jgi:hypothetical protein